MKRFLLYLSALLYLTLANSCLAAEENNTIELNVNIKNHEFEPKILEASANKKILLKVHNLDDTGEEFESHDLKREKFIPANSSVNIILAPLKPGEYSFFGEFHEETAQGKLVIKE